VSNNLPLWENLDKYRFLACTCDHAEACHVSTVIGPHEEAWIKEFTLQVILLSIVPMSPLMLCGIFIDCSDRGHGLGLSRLVGEKSVMFGA
jgi:hypothetical protein